MSAAKPTFSQRLCLTISKTNMPLSVKVHMLLKIGKHKKKKLLIRSHIGSNSATFSWLWNDGQITETNFEASSKEIRAILAGFLRINSTKLISKGFKTEFRDLRVAVGDDNKQIELTYRPRKKRNLLTFFK